MNYDHIFGKLHPLSVLLVVHQKDVASLRRKFVIAALKRIVESLGHLEEAVTAGDNLPASIYLDLIQQRNQLVEHLGDSATHRGGVDHLHRLALEFACEKPQFINVRGADNTFVVIQARRRNWRRRSLPGAGLLPSLATEGRAWRRNRGMVQLTFGCG